MLKVKTAKAGMSDASGGHHGDGYLTRAIRVCCVATFGVGVSVSSGLCAASLEKSSDAFAAPMDVVPWVSAPAYNEKPLLQQLRERDERRDTSLWPAVGSVSFTAVGISRASSAPSPAAASDARSDQRDTFGNFRLPFGRMAVISREVDEYGRISDVNFLQIDDPDSRWDVELDVDDGAMFEISRRWGASNGGRPFANREKRTLAMPY